MTNAADSPPLLVVRAFDSISGGNTIVSLYVTTFATDPAFTSVSPVTTTSAVVPTFSVGNTDKNGGNPPTLVPRVGPTDGVIARTDSGANTVAANDTFKAVAPAFAVPNTSNGRITIAAVTARAARPPDRTQPLATVGTAVRTG